MTAWLLTREYDLLIPMGAERVQIVVYYGFSPPEKASGNQRTAVYFAVQKNHISSVLIEDKRQK